MNKTIQNDDIQGMIEAYQRGVSCLDIGEMLVEKRGRGYVYNRIRHVVPCKTEEKKKTQEKYRMLSTMLETMTYAEVSAIAGVSNGTLSMVVRAFPHAKKSVIRAKKEGKKAGEVAPVKLDAKMGEKVQKWRIRGRDAADVKNALSQAGITARIEEVQAYFDTLPRIRIGFMGMPTEVTHEQA